MSKTGELVQVPSQIGLNLLEASVEVSRCTRHNGFDVERLLAVALLIAPDDAEAPALAVGLLQDDVSAPVHVAETTRTEWECIHAEERDASGHSRCSTSAIPASESTAVSSSGCRLVGRPPGLDHLC